MPYICRDSQGQIDSLHRHPSDTASEWLDEQHPDVEAFLGRKTEEAPGSFNRLDADFVRVIEDVIDTLIVKNVINITDLPSGAQAKLFARKSFRERVSRSSLRLFEPSEFGDVV